jgi:hypothetical protein
MTSSFCLSISNIPFLYVCTTVAITDKAFPERVAQALLKEVADKFVTKYGDKTLVAPDGSLKGAGKFLKSIAEKYVSHSHFISPHPHTLHMRVVSGMAYFIITHHPKRKRRMKLLEPSTPYHKNERKGKE